MWAMMGSYTSRELTLEFNTRIRAYGEAMTANVSIIRLEGDREVCLSYGVPVAAFIPGFGAVKTDKRYSVTSSRHANQYGKKVSGSMPKEMPHAQFKVLVAPLETRD